MFRVKKRLPDLCIAHRLPKHEELCKFVHGHNYKVYLTLRSKDLNNQGMVVDFLEMKAFGQQLKAKFDHVLLLSKQDDLVSRIRKDSREGSIEDPLNLPFGRLQIVDFDPTAENLSRLFFNLAVHFFQPFSCIVDSVEVYETDDSSCTFS